MNQRERFRAIMNSQKYDRLPCINMGFWPETVEKWVNEGHIPKTYLPSRSDYNSLSNEDLCRLLGFEYNMLIRIVRDQPERGTNSGPCSIFPEFEEKKLKTHPDGSEEWLTYYGSIVLHKPGGMSIPAEVDWLLKDRKSWEEIYKPRLLFTEKRRNQEHLDKAVAKSKTDDYPFGMRIGSLIGQIRNMLGIVNLSYMQADDPELLDEIIDTVAETDYQNAKMLLGTGIDYEYAFFWEDICFNKGPLVSPAFFRDRMGPNYKRITDLLARHGVETRMVDCDGKIDALVPVWIENGVNTMYPIEVGTWDGSFETMKKKYGDAVRGIGGMKKSLFAKDKAHIDREMERLRRIVDLGGYLPCPDHSIPPESEWDLVRYYTDRFHSVFG